MLCYVMRLALLLNLTLLSVGATCPPNFLDTGQSQDKGLLSVNGSVDGSPVDLKDEIMAYCPEQTNPLCMVNCTVGFPTMHSPRYFLNGSCFSAGGSGEGLQETGVHTSRPEHPKYSILFPCHAISKYTCYFNDTLYTHVGIRPDAAACGSPRPPPTSPNITTPPGSDGNSTTTNGTTTPSTRSHHPIAVATAGVIVGVVLVVAITAVMAIVLFIVVVYRDRFKPQVYRIVKKLCPCCTKCQLDADNVEAAIPATYDNGNHELVPGVPPPPMGGGQVNVSSVTRET